jgi:hypothetical protein
MFGPDRRDRSRQCNRHLRRQVTPIGPLVAVLTYIAFDNSSRNRAYSTKTLFKSNHKRLFLLDRLVPAPYVGR